VKTQRWALAGLAAIAALSFGTACTQAGTPGSTPTTTPAATDTLAAAAAKTKGQSYKYQLTYGAALTSDGAASGTGSATSANITVGDASSGLMIKAKILVLAKDVYLKLDTAALSTAIPGLAGLGDKWLHLDAAQAPLLARIGVKPGTDTLSPDTMLKGVLTATQSSPTEIKGTLDLAKSAPPGVSADQLASMPANTRNVPFTVTLDAQGRVSKIVINMPAVGSFPASDVTTTYSDFGATVDATAPAATDTVEAPSTLYLFLK
jgi:hypothetical protein